MDAEAATRFNDPSIIPSIPSLQAHIPFDDAGEVEWKPADERTEAIPFANNHENTAEAIYRDGRQGEFWKEKLLFKHTVAAKLREAGATDHAAKLERCRSEASVRRCNSCGKQTVFWNRCDLFFCPACAPKLAAEKKESVKAWSLYIGQPKHVVLTVRNSQTLTKEYVLWLKACFRRLLHRKFCTASTELHEATDLKTRRPIMRRSSRWFGGFYSLEVTKEKNGWHLHIHALVNARWIDCVMLSSIWAEITKQDCAIVKVKDAREKEYLQEVIKYAVKGDTISGWPAPDVATFVRAFDGVRCFAVFGSLYKQRGEFARFLKERQKEPMKCECGACNWKILSLDEIDWIEETSQIPPPKPQAPKWPEVQGCFAPLESSRHLAALRR